MDESVGDIVSGSTYSEEQNEAGVGTSSDDSTLYDNPNFNQDIIEDDSNCDVDAVTPYDDSSLMAVVNQIADNTSTLSGKLNDINITLMYTLQIGVTMIGVVLAVALGRWIYRITNL